MLDTLSLTVAAIVLIAVMAYAFAVANQITGHACPIGIKLAWCGVMGAAGWLLITIVAPLLRPCLIHAVAAFAAAVLVLLVIERRGLRQRYWQKGTP